MRRKGVSLVSFLVFVMIGCIILGSLYHILHKGISVQDATSKSIDMMIQTRAVIENMSRDIKESILFLPPEAQEGENREIVLVLDTSDVAMARYNLDANDPETTSYPFRKPAAETIYQLPVCRVKYMFNKAESTVTRVAEYGVLAYGDSQNLNGTVCRYEFAAASDPAPKTRVVGTDISTFDYSLATIDRSGKPRLIENLIHSDFYLDEQLFNEYKEALQYSQAAIVFLHLKSRFDKGLYGKDPNAPEGTNSRKDRKAEEVEVVTKLISPKCAADVVEREWFSSTDIDLSY